jgi:hypothetical protein
VAPSLPLPVLLCVVVGGVAAVVLLTHLTGGSEKARIDTEDAALARFRLDHPDAAPRAVALTDDRLGALLLLDRGVGVVAVLGDHTLTRLLTPGGLRRVRADAGGLHLRLRDPAAPRLDLALSDPHARAIWLARLSLA